jgi:quercetin dioxygenase-like cupin family protein
VRRIPFRDCLDGCSRLLGQVGCDAIRPNGDQAEFHLPLGDELGHNIGVRTCLNNQCESIPPATLQMTKREADMTRPHQPGQAAFRSILPEDIDWQPFPAFPPAVRLAVIVGHPSEPGPYVIRVKAPGGTKLMPHRHPEDRLYTVMSGVFYIGLGDQFDGDKVQAFPPGSVIVLPGNTSHFHWAKSGEYVTQVTAAGPLGLEYVDPADDPRKGS